jgi:hypothetical protein
MDACVVQNNVDIEKGVKNQLISNNVALCVLLGLSAPPF